MKRAVPDLKEIAYAVDAAAGRCAGSLLIKNVQLMNVFTLELEVSHVLVAGRLIAGVGPSYETAVADVVIDAAGTYLAPGLIDGHVHIESSLVTPSAYTEGVLPRGVTGVVCDPHEIANVAGLAGIRWLLERSESLPLDVWVTAPSCVPSTSLETSGAVLGLPEIEELLQHPRVVGVAEIMSFPAVIAADEENLSKVLLAERYRKSPEGHAPSVSGWDLQAYLAAGIASDHESTTLAEGLEKLRSGVFLMMREGSVTRNLEALLPLLTVAHSHRIGFVTDDRLPHDLLDEGGVDCLVRMAIAAGIDPVLAVRCGSYSTAQHYALPRRGAIAPGYLADMLLVDDLTSFSVAAVYKEGQQVAQAGKLLIPVQPREVDSSPVLNTVKLPVLSEASFQLMASSKEVRCIKAIPYQVLTEELHVSPKTEAGLVVADTERDYLKLACVERYGKTGGVALCLVHGFGLKAGALASTVGHDHHNLLAVGVKDQDMLAACRRLEQLGGGFVAVKDGEVIAELALPIAGLVTHEPLTEVRAKLDKLEAAARALGASIPSPFMTLSFLGLAVIPELRLTDRGLVDVNKSELVSFALES